VALLVGGAARADRLDELAEVLRDDRSYKVRLEAARQLGALRQHRSIPALVDALSDSHPMVRATAATALGKLADPESRAAVERLATRDADETVRRIATRALGNIPHSAFREAGPRAPTSGGILLSVKPAGNKAGAAGRSLAAQMRELVIQELTQVTGLRITDAPKPVGGGKGYIIDGALLRYEVRAAGASVEVTCEVTLVVESATGSILVMTSGEASVEVPRLTFTRGKGGDLGTDALRGAIKAASENVVTFLRSDR
jgi:hypothetical protein